MLPVNENTIHQLLHDLGMFSHMRGFHYLTDLIYLAYTGEIEVRQMKYGYFKVKTKYNKSASAIDRACRYVIDQSYRRYPYVYHELFKFNAKPSITLFVYSAAEYLHEYEKGVDAAGLDDLAEVD